MAKRLTYDISGARGSAVRGAAAEWSGMKEAIRFVGWMSSSQKNTAIRKSYVIATKKYRKALKAKTKTTFTKAYPDTKLNKKGKKTKKLWQTVSYKPAKSKVTNSASLISPLWVGHMVKLGASHQQLLVYGTKAYKQDGQRQLTRRGGGVSKKFLAFTAKSGQTAYGHKRKAVRGKNYVKPIADRFEKGILNDFGDSFILGMRKEARSAKYGNTFY